MNINLTKKFRFESAHRLAKGYEGKCQNIHGHSWNGSLTVVTNKLDHYGMGVDYSVLGSILKMVEKELDHKILLCEEDKEIIQLCDKNNWSYVVFKDNPTSEVIALWMFETIEKFFRDDEQYAHIKVTEVVVEETCTTACTITK